MYNRALTDLPSCTLIILLGACIHVLFTFSKTIVKTPSLTNFFALIGTFVILLTVRGLINSRTVIRLIASMYYFCCELIWQSRFPRKK